MKKIILATFLSLAGSAFAQTCEVDMVETRFNRVIKTYRSYDYGFDCFEAKKQCSKEIRLMGYYGRANCVSRDTTVYVPAPNTRPDYRPTNPDYRPNTNQGSYYDSTREPSINELVVYNNRYYVVVGKSFGGFYTLKTNDTWGTLSYNISRSQISLMKGCNLNLCVNESVIDVSTGRFLKITALSFDNRFVTQTDGTRATLTSNVDRQSLAETKGCISFRYDQICVGDTVINSQNRYYTVAGIQDNGRVVLATNDSRRTISTNIDPINLTVTR